MADIAHVPAPRSPFDGWRGWVVGLVVIGILVAIAKPWGDADVAAERPSPRPDAAPSGAPAVLTPVGLAHDPDAFGADRPAPRWALLTPSARMPLPALEASPDPGIDEPAADDTPIVAGPVIELGTTDDLGTFAIAHPADVSLATMRLWRFVDGGAPRRVDIGTMLSPWPGAPVDVVGHRLPSMAADRILPWDAGLYRLDLLIEPTDAVRSIMLSVRQGSTADDPDTGRPPRAEASFEPKTLRLLPEAANLWSVGRFLSGWHREPARPGCRVAEIWRALDPSDGCWPVPLGGTAAVGVNLPGDETVTAIDLRAVDPLPGPAAAETRVAVDGRPGLAYAAAPAGGLPDGIYRLVVTSARDDGLTWYFEVGPLGRAVAEYYQTSISR